MQEKILLFLIMLVTIALLFSPVIFAFVSHALAQVNKFMTSISEGQTKAVMVNKRFRCFLMSYANHRYRGNSDILPEELDSKNRKWVYSRTKPTDMTGWEETRQYQVQTEGNRVGELRKLKVYRRKETDAEVLERINPHPWDIVEGEEPPSPLSEIFLVGSWLSNIHWIGIYPFAKIDTRKQRWVSWDYPHGKDSSSGSEKKPIPHNEEVDYLILKEDVYWSRVGSAETYEGIPVDIYLLITARVCNPYKAWFIIENWIEATTNQIEADTRELAGKLKFNEFFRGDAATSEMLNDFALQELKRFRSEYGVEVTLVQIQSVEPSGDFKEKYRDLSTKEYEARRLAEARRISAEAEETYIRKTTGTEAEIEKGLREALGEEGYRNLRLSRLTGTLVESGSNALVSVSANNNANKDEEKDPKANANKAGDKNKKEDPKT